MKKTLTIMWKETRDNLRDRRSLFFALVYGPILMPALMFGPLIFKVNKHFQSDEIPIDIHVYGESRAPNLVKFLQQENIKMQSAPDDFEAQIVEGEVDIVLEISETYEDKFIEGTPARIIVHYNKDNDVSQRIFWNIRGKLEYYSRTIASQRMLIRGFDHQLLSPIDIVENDLSKDDFKAGLIANFIMFLAIFSMLMGGFYLATDITAGERERMSLEPLLSLAVTRLQVTMGKYLTILTFVSGSFLLTAISLAIWIYFIPEDFFGNADTPTIITFIKLSVLMLPMCLLISGLLMAFSTFSKSTKEAQTHLGIAMIIPMAPFFVVQFMNVKLSTLAGLVPILGQYLIAEKIIIDSGFILLSMFPGALVTIASAAALFSIAVYRYKQDSILG